jgi:hypothetical protein
MARVNIHKYLASVNQDGLLIVSKHGLERPKDKFRQWDVNRIIVNDYSDVVDDAINNESAFQNFKRKPNYVSIVGMCDDFQARIWLERAEKEFPQVIESIDTFKKNDTIGNPGLWDSKKYGMISPDTMHRINTLCDIEKYFGGLNNKNVVEIGVGYGGLCFVLSSFYDIKSYELVDLDNVVALSKKCLTALNVETNSGGTEDFDLTISEFCITELDNKGISYYYERYIQKSKSIYLMMNPTPHKWPEKRLNDFHDILAEDFEIEIHEEFPKMVDFNYLIIGHKK